MRATLALLLCALGCTRIDPTQPAPYLCSPDAGDSAQCPGGWKCGFEHFCVDPATPAPYRCQDTATDCTGGWKCSFDGVCVDPNAPAALHCEDSLLHCTGGWKCSFDGVCVDPTAPAPLHCTDSMLHCTGGWHCGPSGVCYDRNDAGPIACRATDPLDCANTWRCGLNGSCHERDAGAPYECIVDDDCEARWRCGPDRRCVDATVDGLQLTGDAGSAFGELINPALPMARADLVSGSQAGTVSRCGRTFELDSTTLVYGSRLVKWVGYGRDPGGLWLECSDGGALPPVQLAEVRELDLGQSPLAIVDQGARTLVLLADAGLTQVLYTPLAALAVSPLAPPFPVTGLRGRKNGSAPVAIVFNAANAAVLDGTTFTVTPPLPPGLDGGLPTLRDVDLYDTRLGTGAPGLIAATDQGISFASGSGSGFGQLKLAWRDCGQDLSVEHVYGLGGMSTLGAIARLRKPGPLDTWGVQFFRLSQAAPMCTGVSDVGSGFYLSSFSSSCLPGVPNHVRSFFGVTISDGGVDGIALADGSDGGVLYLSCHAESFASTGAGPFLPTATHSTSNSQLLTVSDDHGGLWSAEQDEPFVFQPLTLSRLPSAVAGRVDSFGAFTEAVLSDPQKADSRTLMRAGHFEHAIDAGVPLLTRLFGLLAPVVGKPDWRVTPLPLSPGQVSIGVTNGVPTPSRPPYALALSDDALEMPVHAAFGATDAGGTLLVSASDLLVSVDLSPVLPNGVFVSSSSVLPLVPRLKYATTPLPRAKITSLVALPAGGQPESSYALGYLVASGRVFRFKADNPVVFRSDEVFIEPNEAISVWADGTRARVGFAGGAVYGLPSRARLAGPLPVAEHVVEFQAVCGHQFALTDRALWRLEVTPNVAVGTWRPVPLQASDAGFSLAGAKLLSDDRGLVLFRERGIVEQLRGVSCLP